MTIFIEAMIILAFHHDRVDGDAHPHTLDAMEELYDMLKKASKGEKLLIEEHIHSMKSRRKDRVFDEFCKDFIEDYL